MCSSDLASDSRAHLRRHENGRPHAAHVLSGMVAFGRLAAFIGGVGSRGRAVGYAPRLVPDVSGGEGTRRRADDFRIVARAHVIAWRKSLEDKAMAPATIRRKLSALSDLFDYLCKENAIVINPVHGVERPTEGANEGKTPAISDEQARQLLNAPDPTTLKGKRDRAILAVLLYHGLRRAEIGRAHV